MIKIKEKYYGPSSNSTYLYRWAYGYEWRITFTSQIGNLPEIVASPSISWTGTNPTINVFTEREGTFPLGGSFQLSYKGEKTDTLSFDASSEDVKVGLESLETIGLVEVSMFQNNNGFNYFVTFLSEIGDLPSIIVHDAQLTGPNAKARIATIRDGITPNNFGSKYVPSPSESRYTITGLENEMHTSFV